MLTSRHTLHIVSMDSCPPRGAKVFITLLHESFEGEGLKYFVRYIDALTSVCRETDTTTGVGRETD